MAATRIIPLHINKGKTLTQCLADRTGYSQDKKKTENGKYVSTYECNPETVNEEFLLSKIQYQQETGRHQKNDVIAYQIRQSFKPGEITPEEANEVGYETAMRFLKGKYAFIVATHTDRAHIHNHIIFNSTSLNGTGKFRNFFMSFLAVQRLSDMICLEHGLSVINPKPYHERIRKNLYNRISKRSILCKAIDSVLNEKPISFEEFTEKMISNGYEFKSEKYLAFRNKEDKKFIRLSSLSEDYSEENIKAVISGKPIKKADENHFNMLIDVQAKISEGKGKGYERWAKKFNRKETAKTIILLKEKGIDSYEALQELTGNLTKRFDELSDIIKSSEKRMNEISMIQTHINNYSRTRKIYIEYRKSGYSKKFFEAHREDILIHKAAKDAFSRLEKEKIPTRKELDDEFHRLIDKKKKAYSEYNKVKKEMKEYLIARQTVENILGLDREKEKNNQKQEER